MTKEQEYVKNFMDAAGQTVPQKPIIPDRATRELRARLILEETLETVKALGFRVRVAEEQILFSTPVMGFYLVEEFQPNLEEIADGCADIQVVTLGTTLACGIDQEPIDAEVNRSNMSKFIDGYKHPETGKWIKGKSYSPANIAPILEEQSK